MIEVTIEDWIIIRRLPKGFDPEFIAPETVVPYIVGNFYNDPRIQGGKLGKLNLSRIVRNEGDVLISKSGNRYRLGNPSEDYEAKFPHAKETFLRNLDNAYS